MKDSATGQAQVQIAPSDINKSVSAYGELLRAFLQLNMMISVAAKDWFSRIEENGTSTAQAPQEDWGVECFRPPVMAHTRCLREANFASARENHEISNTRDTRS
jgi:hypothetical protein